ncbi:MAG: hypothetical protein ACKVJK_09740 [Methylophagaceae bacterium]
MNDGRESMWDIWRRYKRNNHDHCGPIGEFVDNSVSWGKATEIIMFLKENKIIICDNGIFDRKRFPDTFSMGADKFKEFYNPEDPDQIGKYNMGVSESTMILGEKGICMHRFGNEGVRVTKLDRELSVYNNRISTNDEPANESELRNFNTHINQLETSFDEGTMMTIEGTNKITKEYISCIYRFMLGLYPLKTDLKIRMYDMTACSPTSFDAAIIKKIEPNDLRFGSEPVTCNMNVINNNGNVAYVETTTNDYHSANLSYKFEVQCCTFSKESQRDEKNEFGNTTDEQMVGFRFFRGGRLISGPKPLRFGLSTGMNRAKGLRLYVYLPSNNETVDDDFKIGTQKKMTESLWEHFGPKLCKWFEKKFSDALKESDNIIKLRSSKFIADTNNKINELKQKEETIQDDELSDMLSSIKSEYVTIYNKTHEYIVKRSGKSYNALVEYDNEVKRIISERAEAAKEAAPAAEAEKKAAAEAKKKAVVEAEKKAAAAEAKKKAVVEAKKKAAAEAEKKAEAAKAAAAAESKKKAAAESKKKAAAEAAKAAAAAAAAEAEKKAAAESKKKAAAEAAKKTEVEKIANRDESDNTLNNHFTSEDQKKYADTTKQYEYYYNLTSNQKESYDMMTDEQKELTKKVRSDPITKAHMLLFN